MSFDTTTLIYDTQVHLGHREYVKVNVWGKIQNNIQKLELNVEWLEFKKCTLCDILCDYIKVVNKK